MGTLALSTQEQKEALCNQDPTSIAAALQAQEGQAEQVIQNQQDGNHLRGRKLQTDHAIVLENVAAGFVKPNILDVKLGSRLWADDAPPTKRAKLDKVAKETTSGSLGFRLAGMRVWHPSNASEANGGSYQVFDRNYGRELSPDTVQKGFEQFFLKTSATGRTLTPLRRIILQLCEAELAKMTEALEDEESRMYSASILLVYEGDEAALKEAARKFEDMQEKAANKAQSHSNGRFCDDGHAHENHDEDGDEDEDEDEEEVPRMFAVKFIDFAHAAWTPGQGPDENILPGVRSVASILKDMLR